MLNFDGDADANVDVKFEHTFMPNAMSFKTSGNASKMSLLHIPIAFTVVLKQQMTNINTPVDSR